MSENRVYMIMSNDEFREVTKSEFTQQMNISPEDIEELSYITNEKENEIMEGMNSKLSVKYEYKDARNVKQQEEFSMSSNYTDGFSKHRVVDFMLNVIRLTGYSEKTILFEALEVSDYIDEITDQLNYLGYGSKAEEE